MICSEKHCQNQNKNLNSVASDSKLPYDELQKSETASRVGQNIAGMHPADGKFSVFVWIKGGAPGQVILSQESGVNWLAADGVEKNINNSKDFP